MFYDITYIYMYMYTIDNKIYSNMMLYDIIDIYMYMYMNNNNNSEYIL